MLNTKETRKLVWDMIAQKRSSVWRTWTNAVEKDLAVDNTKRNLCFGMLPSKVASYTHSEVERENNCTDRRDAQSSNSHHTTQRPHCIL